MVGTVAASDPDADGLIYALTDDAGGRFAIDAATGQITVADGSLLDYEVATQHDITVKVTDPGGLSDTATFAITVGDLDDTNEAPSITGLSGDQVDENAADDTVVGTVAASDPDADGLTYALTDDAGGRFAIDATGQITVADGALLDYEDATQHSVTVEVTDPDGLSDTATFAIDVQDVNKSPSITGLSGDQLDENAAADTVVGTVAASDPDADGLTYSLTDDAGGRFAIDPVSGQITVANGALLDYEDATQHNVTVNVTDPDGLSDTATYAIDVQDVNESPSITGLSGDQVDENAADDTLVGTVAASDPDADGLTYALTDDAGGRFAIDAATGQITVADGTLLDHESATQHDITVKVTDPGGLTDTATFAITVGDLDDTNDAPSITGLSGDQVDENAADDTVVGTVAASDPDADSLTYSLTDDAGGRFAIDPASGQITVANGALLDYEDATQHNVTVKVTDPGGLSDTATFAIAVGDLDDTGAAPVIAGLSGQQVDENAADDTVVGTVAASDLDGDGLTYSLTDDAGGRFAIDAATGQITVADAALLDYEDAAQHNITVKVTDPGGLSDTATYAIDIQNVNEAPAIASLSADQVDENVADDTVVGTVAASDPDGDGLTYALTDDAGGRFAIDPASGQITVANGALLDYEDATQHNVTVKVTDPGGLSDTATYAIDVRNVNEAPAIAGLSGDQVDENAADDTVVGTVAASDPDADGFAYSLTDDAGGRFAVDATTGQITVANGALLDYEDATQHNVTVKVTDPGGLSDTATYAIDVRNLNEAPAIAGLSGDQVDENAADETVVGTVAASDPEGDSFTYALIDDAGGRFAIDSSGVISVADGTLLDHEIAGQHDVTVKVTDGGGQSDSATFTIDVGDVNEAPEGLELTGNDVIEGSDPGTVVGTASASDPDGDSLTFALTDDAGGRFAIDPISGVISVADGTLIEYDEATEHNITVEVTDPEGLSGTETFVVDVQKDNSGDDTMIGTDEADTIDGGPGNDSIFGEAGDDVLLGGAGDDFLFGDKGDDQLSGGDGNDQLLGGIGNDLIEGGDGDDELFGSIGDDVLKGGEGNDVLYGSLGSDLLLGGAGNDTLRGEAGADRFVFESLADGVDKVLDFSSAEGDVLAIGNMLEGFAEGDEASFVRLVAFNRDIGGEFETGMTVEVDVDGAANGENYQPLVDLLKVPDSLTDLVDAGNIDFWLS